MKGDRRRTSSVFLPPAKSKACTTAISFVRHGSRLNRVVGGGQSFRTPMCFLALAALLIVALMYDGCDASCLVVWLRGAIPPPVILAFTLWDIPDRLPDDPHGILEARACPIDSTILACRPKRPRSSNVHSGVILVFGLGQSARSIDLLLSQLYTVP